MRLNRSLRTSQGRLYSWGKKIAEGVCVYLLSDGQLCPLFLLPLSAHPHFPSFLPVIEQQAQGRKSWHDETKMIRTEGRKGYPLNIYCYLAKQKSDQPLFFSPTQGISIISLLSHSQRETSE